MLWAESSETLTFILCWIQFTVYSKDKESQSFFLVYFWTIYAQNTPRYAAVSELTSYLPLGTFFVSHWILTSRWNGAQKLANI